MMIYIYKLKLINNNYFVILNNFNYNTTSFSRQYDYLVFDCIHS